MNNYTYLFAMISLFLGVVLLTEKSSSSKVRVYLWSIPESKGCVYPTKEIRYIHTEIKRTVSLIHICKYDDRNRLSKVSTYNFERGYLMKEPLKEVLYLWADFRLSQYSIRSATHGEEREVYRFLNRE
jgi:hypothetical protein